MTERNEKTNIISIQNKADDCRGKFTVMKSVKHMTLDQIKRIQLNNYCSEHDKHGKQFDYEALGYPEGLCPKAEKLYNEMMSLPLYYAMSDQDVDDVINAVHKLVMYYCK